MSELSGIIRNGVERGWPAEEIKASLLNSGYSAQEIDYELSQLSKVQLAQQVQSVASSPQPTKSIHSPVQPSKFNPQDLTNYQSPPVEKKAGNWMVIAIVALLVLCVLAGAGLFLFG